MRYAWLLGAWALSACDTGIKPTATISAADSADQVLDSMSHYMTSGGVMRAHVLADTAYFYSPSQTAELRQVHITFYDTRGAQTSTLTSREGTYHWRTGDMEARGSVVVVRTDGATLRTEVIRYSQAKNQVSSDRDFVFHAERLFFHPGHGRADGDAVAIADGREKPRAALHDGDADDPVALGHQADGREVEEARDDLPLRQVAGHAVEDDDVVRRPLQGQQAGEFLCPVCH